MKYFVTDWGASWFDTITMRRVHMVETDHGWMHFAEYKTARGSVSFSDVCPTGFPPSAEFTKVAKVAA